VGYCGVLAALALFTQSAESAPVFRVLAGVIPGETSLECPLESVMIGYSGSICWQKPNNPETPILNSMINPTSISCPSGHLGDNDSAMKYIICAKSCLNSKVYVNNNPEGLELISVNYFSYIGGYTPTNAGKFYAKTKNGVQDKPKSYGYYVNCPNGTYDTGIKCINQ
jgi:hypothetical protein